MPPHFLEGATLGARDRFTNSALYQDWDSLRLVSRFQLARDTDDAQQRDLLLSSLRKSRGLPADLSKQVDVAFALFHTSLPLGVRCRAAMNSAGAAAEVCSTWRAMADGPGLVIPLARVPFRPGSSWEIFFEGVELVHIEGVHDDV